MSDRQPPNEIFALVYDELRRLAAAELRNEKPWHTLSATALVHEAYLRLAAGPTSAERRERGPFLSAAAQAMRWILVDHARRRRAGKRGAGVRAVELSDDIRIECSDPDTLLAIDEALERLEKEDPIAAEIARLQLFAGISVEEAGIAKGIPRASAYREWAFARAFLIAAMSGDNFPPEKPPQIS